MALWHQVSTPAPSVIGGGRRESSKLSWRRTRGIQSAAFGRVMIWGRVAAAVAVVAVVAAVVAVVVAAVVTVVQLLLL